MRTGGGEGVAWEEGVQLIGSMGLVWREACICAQIATSPSKGFVFFMKLPLLLSTVVHIVLYSIVYIFSLLQVKNKTRFSEYEHAFTLWPVS
jgi:hypothetical protein